MLNDTLYLMSMLWYGIGRPSAHSPDLHKLHWYSQSGQKQPKCLLIDLSGTHLHLLVLKCWMILCIWCQCFDAALGDPEHTVLTYISYTGTHTPGKSSLKMLNKQILLVTANYLTVVYTTLIIIFLFPRTNSIWSTSFLSDHSNEWFFIMCS